MAGGRGIPFVVSAPSGTGKTSVCRSAVARDPRLVFSVSHTTRRPRPGERDGADYHFVRPDGFARLAAEGAFLEHAEYNGNRYGTSWAAVEQVLARGCDALLEIEIQGARQVRTRRDDAVLVFLLPPSWAELERRLRGRGTDSEAEVARRLATARDELRAVFDETLAFDYALVNRDLEATVDALLEIVAAERAHRSGDARARWARRVTVERLPWLAEAVGEG